MMTNEDKPICIYLVDDDIDDQEIFSSALSEIEIPVELFVFSNAMELLDSLSQLNLNPNKPDAIFLDLYMPKMDGEECLVNIRKNIDFEDIPVLIYSTEYDLDRIEKLFSLGANRYLRKADSYSSLVEALIKTVASIKRNALGSKAVINIIV